MSNHKIINESFDHLITEINKLRKSVLEFDDQKKQCTQTGQVEDEFIKKMLLCEELNKYTLRNYFRMFETVDNVIEKTKNLLTEHDCEDHG